MEEQLHELEKRVEKLEQQTEPIKVTRIEIDPSGIREHLAETNKLLRGIAQTQPDHGEKLDTLERGQQSIRQDIVAIHDVFVKDFDRIETTMATKDDVVALKAEHGAKLDLILQLLQQ